ncbi:serine/threonine-protein kinase [Helicobacter felis]|uniref:serine/threonine-protein kinase n=1 Tax=Helicobacter felis TaxID=214 RepID=UPI000CF0C1C7|nr:serine/threonine-protein kinase [Helicobacter felis]
MRVLDTFGNRHVLGEVLSEGGGGKVYQTSDKDVLVKIAGKNGQELTQKEDIEAFCQVVQNLMRMPIPKEIPLVLPLALLQDRAGYVMPSLTSLKPLGAILKEGSAIISTELKNIHPFWAKFFQERLDLQTLFTYYIHTGGARLRLKVLARLAAVLFRLHAHGLIYGDLSKGNVLFEDQNKEHPSVYLIDTEDICYTRKEAIGTFPYQPPEFFQGQTSMESDIYAFGIVAYWLLTTNHPFLDGAQATKEDWQQCAWVQDRTDESNAKTPLFKLEYVLSQEGEELFHTLFEEGRSNPKSRPSLALFVQALELSALSCLECARCAMHYKEELEICPYCDAPKPKRLCATSYFFHQEQRGRVYAQFVLRLTQEPFSVHLPTCLFKGVDVLDMQADFLEVRPDLLIFKKKKGFWSIKEN